jgi:hypothetical protein
MLSLFRGKLRNMEIRVTSNAIVHVARRYLQELDAPVRKATEIRHRRAQLRALVEKHDALLHAQPDGRSKTSPG